MRKATCKCGKPIRSVGQKHCADCHRAYMRVWRKTHRLSAEQRMKDNCRSYAGVYLRRGKLVRQACACGNPDSQMHHPDYAKPLQVVWMCRECHLDLHRKQAA